VDPSGGAAVTASTSPAAAVLAAITNAADHPDLNVWRDPAGDVVGSPGVLAAIAVDALRDRLLPEATQTSTEWGVWWHGTDPHGICLTSEHLRDRTQAEKVAVEKVGQYGITGYTLVSCEHRRYADGSTWISAWRRVETVMPSGQLACG
jgi:hypothetical protein